MTDRELVALMAATIYAGIMANPSDEVYTTAESCVDKAKAILDAVEGSPATAHQDPNTYRITRDAVVREDSPR